MPSTASGAGRLCGEGASDERAERIQRAALPQQALQVATQRCMLGATGVQCCLARVGEARNSLLVWTRAAGCLRLQARATRVHHAHGLPCCATLP